MVTRGIAANAPVVFAATGCNDPVPGRSFTRWSPAPFTAHCFNSYTVGKDAGAFRLTQSSEIPNPAEAVSRLMPIEGYKERWGNARRWGYANTAATSERPMSHVSQRNARNHGSVTRGLVFQKRAMTASTPIVTNGSAAEIANNPSNTSFASGLIIHHFTPR
jgi:hypothetical protein